ncbi:MAG TPA: FtsQ-type POTRA domain-containing protein [Gemmatimonadales bacterium]|nr:FtsQ-type POTRA domain-containing protein [Gemmatimonadales bacterium]
MAERRLKPGWKAVGGAVVAAALWFGAPAALRQVEFFRVRRVELQGSQYLDAAKVIAAAQLSRTASVFDDPEAIARRVRALPGVQDVSVSRRLPGTLRIRLKEAEPVALTPKGDRLAMVDARGAVLPFDPLASAPNLPVLIGGGALVAGALARTRDYDPGLFARIDAAWRVGPDVVFEVAGRWLWFDPQLTAEDIRAVTAVEQTLARQGRQFAELDGRYAGQVVVRRVRA